MIMAQVTLVVSGFILYDLKQDSRTILLTTGLAWILKLGVQDSHFGKNRSPHQQKVEVPPRRCEL